MLKRIILITSAFYLAAINKIATDYSYAICDSKQEHKKTLYEGIEVPLIAKSVHTNNEYYFYPKIEHPPPKNIHLQEPTLATIGQKPLEERFRFGLIESISGLSPDKQPCIGEDAGLVDATQKHKTWKLLKKH